MALIYDQVMQAVLLVLMLLQVTRSAQESSENLASWKTRRRRETLGFLEESEESCEVARLKCAYRSGCGMALQNYMVGCSDVMSGSSKRCSEHCRNSLIALTSTEEGQALMKCKCNDPYCLDAKRRIDVCRTAVIQATSNTTTVSCSVAQWICMADSLCSTALDYYHRLCRSMFAGKKCTPRCKNSISILRRQEKADKLNACTCDGSEDFDCLTIRHNMEGLCFHKPPVTSTTTTTTTTVAPPKKGGGSGAGEEEEETGQSGTSTSADGSPSKSKAKPNLTPLPGPETNQIEEIPSGGATATSGTPSSLLFWMLPLAVLAARAGRVVV